MDPLAPPFGAGVKAGWTENRKCLLLRRCYAIARRLVTRSSRTSLVHVWRTSSLHPSRRLSGTTQILPHTGPTRTGRSPSKRADLFAGSHLVIQGSPEVGGKVVMVVQVQFLPEDTGVMFHRAERR